MSQRLSFPHQDRFPCACLCWKVLSSEESSKEDTPACHQFLPAIIQSQRLQGLKAQGFILWFELGHRVNQPDALLILPCLAWLSVFWPQLGNWSFSLSHSMQRGRLPKRPGAEPGAPGVQGLQWFLLRPDRCQLSSRNMFSGWLLFLPQRSGQCPCGPIFSSTVRDSRF